MLLPRWQPNRPGGISPNDPTPDVAGRRAYSYSAAVISPRLGHSPRNSSTANTNIYLLVLRWTRLVLESKKLGLSTVSLAVSDQLKRQEHP